MAAATEFEFNSVLKLYQVSPLPPDIAEEQAKALARFRSGIGEDTPLTESWLDWVEYEPTYSVIGLEHYRRRWDMILTLERAMQENSQITMYSNSERINVVPLEVDIMGLSISGLDEVQYSIVANQYYHLQLGNLYTISNLLGRGVHGTVYGLTMRTGELDAEVLRIMLDKSNEDPYLAASAIYSAVRQRPKYLAVKVGPNSDWQSTMREYVIGRQVANVLYPLGIRAVPAVFSVTRLELEESGIDYVKYRLEFGPNAEGRMVGRLVSNNVDVAQVEANITSGGILTKRLYSPDELAALHQEIRYAPENESRNKLDEQREVLTTGDTLMYQEYVNGMTLSDALEERIVGPSELNVILCYIFGLLGYLYNEIGFVHNDLHYNNIMLRNGSAILPILSSGETRYIQLPYQPMILDLGLAKTNSFSIPTSVSGPTAQPMNDMINLSRHEMYWTPYANIHPSNVISHGILKEELWRTDKINIDTLKHTYLGPYIQYKSKLRHWDLVERIAASGALNDYLVPKPLPALQQRSNLFTYNEFNAAQLIVDATTCEELYLPKLQSSDATIQVFAHAVVAYCRGVRNFHARMNPILRTRPEVSGMALD